MKANLALGIMTILFSSFFLIVNLRMPETNSSTPVGPKEWPTIILILMLTMGIILVVKFIWKSKYTLPNNESRKSPDMEVKNTHWYIVIAIILYLILLPYVGFIVDTLFLFCFLVWLLGIRKIPKLITITLISNIAFVLLFIYTLQIPFPKGMGIFESFSSFIY